MANPTFSVGGLASGLDTTAIIQQLVQIERQPIVRFQTQQSDLRAKNDAWSKIVTRVSGLRSALDDVRKVGQLSELTAATSSNESAVEVTATGGGTPSDLSFSVDALAKRHRVGFSGTFGSSSDVVEAGTYTFTDETGGEIGSITTDGTTSVADLASEISGLGIGINASVLKVSDSGYQLILSSSETGLSNQFSVATTATDVGTASVLEAGDDAQLSIGGLVITRSSNTINDLIDGVELKLRAETTSDVTITVDRDDDAIVEDVKALVDQFNSLLSDLESLTSYNPETERAGPLQGDPTARDLSFKLRASLFEVVGTGALTYAGDVGIGLTDEGQVSLDETELRDALAENAAGVFGLLAQSLGGDSGVELNFANDDATAGDFSMSVSQAASVASVTGANYTPPVGPFTITTSNGTQVTVSVDPGMSASDAVARINSALDAAEVSEIRASADGDDLTIASVGYGSARTFTIAGHAGLDGTYTGTDVIANFGNGSADVTGSGRSVAGTEGADGLTLTVTGGLGDYDLNFSSGVGGVLNDFLNSLEGVDGLLQGARNSLDEGIADYDDQIEAYEIRVSLREGALRRKYSALESTLGTLQSQGSWLAGQLASLG